MKTITLASIALLATLSAVAVAQDAPKTDAGSITAQGKHGTVTFPGYYQWEYNIDPVVAAEAASVDDIKLKPKQKK